MGEKWPWASRMGENVILALESLERGVASGCSRSEYSSGEGSRVPWERIPWS